MLSVGKLEKIVFGLAKTGCGDYVLVGRCWTSCNLFPIRNLAVLPLRSRRAQLKINANPNKGFLTKGAGLMNEKLDICGCDDLFFLFMGCCTNVSHF